MLGLVDHDGHRILNPNPNPTPDLSLRLTPRRKLRRHLQT